MAAVLPQTAMHAPAPRFDAAIEAALHAHESTPASRAGEHLAEYSFRFDASPPPAPATERPNGSAPWTLAQTLQEIRLRDAVVTETTRGLRVRHAHRLPGLAAAVRRHAGEVRLWLRLGAGRPADGWDDATALYLRWLQSGEDVTAGPVALRPGVTITDWARFVASVESQAAEGPGAPGAAGLRRDLADLFDRHAILDAPAVLAHAPARAA